MQCPRLSRQCTLVRARVELYENSSSSGKSSSSRWRVCGTRPAHDVFQEHPSKAFLCAHVLFSFDHRLLLTRRKQRENVALSHFLMSHTSSFLQEARGTREARVAHRTTYDSADWAVSIASHMPQNMNISLALPYRWRTDSFV